MSIVTETKKCMNPNGFCIENAHCEVTRKAAVGHSPRDQQTRLPGMVLGFLLICLLALCAGVCCQISSFNTTSDSFFQYGHPGMDMKYIIEWILSDTFNIIELFQNP